MKLPKRVEIVEVGPRDGLQNESQFIPTAKKRELIHALNQTGIKRIEVTSFVHPVHVPQMKDAAEVWGSIEKIPDIQYMALIPNETGYLRAVESGAQAVALVVGASNTFNEKNVRMSREKSFENLQGVIQTAKEDGVFVRFHIATSFWCPFEGRVPEEEVLRMVGRLEALDVDEIVICDTIGRANPKQVFILFSKLFDQSPTAKITAHFHDTYGFAQANVVAALQAGVTVFDSSVAGLGGCPFAHGAAGNIATEDLVVMLHEMGIETDIELDKLLNAVGLARSMTKRFLYGHYFNIVKGQAVKQESKLNT